MIVADRFKEQFSPGHYTRVDANHPLDIYIGLDEQGHYALEFRGQFTPQPVKPSSAIGITQYQKADFASVTFWLTDREMLENFCVFCDDIIVSTNSIVDANQGYIQIINRFYSWKKMFQTSIHIMDESKIMGLIGELLFLRDYMIPIHGAIQALRSWSGQELTHKDFSLETIWYEVKTISTGKASVKISSLEQLQSANNGELVVFQLEKMSPAYEGVNLNILAREILKLLDCNENKDLFINKLIDSGFSFDLAYAEFVYDVSTAERYYVDPSFPKLTPANVVDAITKVQYEILLAFIQQYKIDWNYGN